MDIASEIQTSCNALEESNQGSNPDSIWCAYKKLMDSVARFSPESNPQRISIRQQLHPIIAKAIQRMIQILYQNRECGDHTSMKRCAFYVLSMVDRTKSTETSTKAIFPFHGIGSPESHQIPEHPTIFNLGTLRAVSEAPHSKARRERVRGILDKWIYSYNQRPNDVGHSISADIPKDLGPFPNLDNILTLSTFTNGEDIILILDRNTHHFTYDDNFRNYEYPADRFVEEPGAIPPRVLVLKKPRSQFIEILNIIELEKERNQRNGTSGVGAELLQRLGKYMEIETLLREIEADQHLIWIPDDVFRVLPLSAVIDDRGGFLFRRVSSIAQVQSLTSFKWSLYKNFYYCLPQVRYNSPKLMFYGVPTTQVPNCGFLPGVLEEYDRIKKYFSGDEICAFGDFGLNFGHSMGWLNTAAVDTFFTYHADADILWFSGHGFSGRQLLLQTEFGDMRFHESGIILYDAALSNLYLQTSGIWNFSKCWLVVINACTTGIEDEIAREAVGFPSSLYLMGAISIIASRDVLWDDIAAEFAGGVASALKDGLSKIHTLGGRAQAFKAGLESVFSGKEVEANPLLGAGYVLLGVP